MKREFLKQQIPGITDEQINAILNENGNDLADLRSTITKHENTIQTLTTERDGYKDQVTERDKDIKVLRDQVKGNEDLTKQLGDLQTKYDTDTKALQKKLDDQMHDRATEAVFAGVEFSSNLARTAAIAAFRAKGYKLGEDGKYAEAQSFLDQLKKDEPTAFKTEEPKDEGKKNEGGNPGGQPYAPRFTSPMGNGTNPADGAGKSNFGLSFNFVRTPPKE